MQSLFEEEECSGKRFAAWQRNGKKLKSSASLRYQHLRTCTIHSRQNFGQIHISIERYSEVSVKTFVFPCLKFRIPVSERTVFFVESVNALLLRGVDL